jgi:hypothetical protein
MDSGMPSEGEKGVVTPWAMAPGLLKSNGPLASADSSMTHRSLWNANPNPGGAPGYRPLDAIGQRSPGEMKEGILSMQPLVGSGPSTNARALMRKR